MPMCVVVFCVCLCCVCLLVLLRPLVCGYSDVVVLLIPLVFPLMLYFGIMPVFWLFRMCALVVENLVVLLGLLSVFVCCCVFWSSYDVCARPISPYACGVRLCCCSFVLLFALMLMFCLCFVCLWLLVALCC